MKTSEGAGRGRATGLHNKGVGTTTARGIQGIVANTESGVQPHGSCIYHTLAQATT
jgi:hypothetical protein